MATALIVVALLVGGLGAIRWRRLSDDGGVTGAPSSGSSAPRPVDAADTTAGALGPGSTSGSGNTSGPGDAGGPADAPGPESADTDDLDAAFDRVLAAHSHELGILLGSRLQRLVDRRVPVRSISEAPGTMAVRVGFADGTVVLAKGVVPGDFVRIAWGIHISSVRLHAFNRIDTTTHLDLRWQPNGAVGIVALGLDQPD
ncbi:MAG: hypothetical protein ABI083_19385 [Lapillicoccus sp.]